MNDTPSPVAAGSAGSGVTLESLAAAHQSLKTALHVTLVMLVILSGSLFIFFLREISIARRQINELTAVVVDYEKKAVPLMEDFRTKLQVFAKSHPDFIPIYAKYFGNTNVTAAANRLGRPQPLTNAAGPRLPSSR